MVYQLRWMEYRGDLVPMTRYTVVWSSDWRPCQILERGSLGISIVNCHDRIASRMGCTHPSDPLALARMSRAGFRTVGSALYASLAGQLAISTTIPSADMITRGEVMGVSLGDRCLLTADTKAYILPAWFAQDQDHMFSQVLMPESGPARYHMHREGVNCVWFGKDPEHVRCLNQSSMYTRIGSYGQMHVKAPVKILHLWAFRSILRLALVVF